VFVAYIVFGYITKFVKYDFDVNNSRFEINPFANTSHLFASLVVLAIISIPIIFMWACMKCVTVENYNPNLNNRDDPCMGFFILSIIYVFFVISYVIPLLLLYA
jgi:hypothetical protein